MPRKLQIKTVSNSGELLNVINCPAGRVCVFRGNTPADLRPYQRALIGSHGKEKLSVTVDGKEYLPEQQNLIGLGESAPYAGLTTRQYLTGIGILEDALVGLLTSYGLESVIDTTCSTLAQDQERRIRLLAATADPSKALIVNEPFEGIGNQWRERFAELLLSFVKNQEGLLVIPSLSYRPECWIDNALISRIEVGQSIQRTIGFGAAGSDSNQLMADLKKQILQDKARDEKRAASSLSVGAIAAGVAMQSGVESNPSDLSLIKAWLASRDSLAFKVIGTVLASGVGILTALTVMGVLPKLTGQEAILAPAQLQQAAQTEVVAKVPNIKDLIVQGDVNPTGASQAALAKSAAVLPSVIYILDGYPEVIRASVLETVHGIVGEVAIAEANTAAIQAAPAAPRSGNLYSLLESASSKTDGGDAKSGSSYPPEYPAPAYEAQEEQDETLETTEETTDEATQRDVIRSKFLEAIRSAAERRESALDEE